MNILIVTETYPPEINGVARTLAKMVDGLTGRGHRVTLVRPAQASSAEGPTLPSTVQVHEVPGAPLPGYPGLQFGLPARHLFRRLLAAGSIDAAYIATEGPLGHSALHGCLACGVPALSGMHTNFHQYSGHYGASLLAPLLLRYLRRFHNRMAGTLVPTRAMADALHADGFRHLHVWPRGVQADLFSPARRDPQLRQQWGVGDNDLVVLYVGRIAPEKNIDAAFDAFATIRRRHPAARFVLVGDGPAEKRLREQHPDALFLGTKTGEGLARHYASGDLFLFPSQTETFGNVTLEAMSSGLPVVSYDLAAAHELITDGHNGMLAISCDGAAFTARAVACADDPELRKTLSSNAREMALQQDWPKLITRLETLFLAVCREPGGKPNESTTASTERP